MDKEILEILKRLDEGQQRLEKGQKEFDTHLKTVDENLKRLETKIDEHTLTLRALEHSAQVNKAEHDKISNDIAKIQGNVAGIKKDLSQVEMVTANN